VCDYLFDLEQEGTLEYETGASSQEVLREMQPENTNPLGDGCPSNGVVWLRIDPQGWDSRFEPTEFGELGRGSHVHRRWTCRENLHEVTVSWRLHQVVELAKPQIGHYESLRASSWFAVGEPSGPEQPPEILHQ
jgi:hypothetical protein